MANSHTIFLAAGEPLETTAGRIAAALQLERVDDPDLKDDQYFFRGRARTVDGRVLLVVGPNIYGEDNPEPEDVSAIDRYSGVVDVRIAGSRNEEQQLREARALRRARSSAATGGPRPGPRDVPDHGGVPAGLRRPHIPGGDLTRRGRHQRVAVLGCGLRFCGGHR
ncbi:hypothetical protein GCM10010530_54910 [Kribbella aluminosa]